MFRYYGSTRKSQHNQWKHCARDLHGRRIKIHPLQPLPAIHALPLSQTIFRTLRIPLHNIHPHHFRQVRLHRRMSLQSIQERSIGSDIACMQDAHAGVGIRQQEPTNVG